MVHHAVPLLLSISLLLACRPAVTPVATETAGARGQIMLALDHYLTAAKVVDPNGMAASFTVDGVLFEPDSWQIRRYFRVPIPSPPS